MLAGREKERESIIYVRSSGEFRSFNSSVTFVSGLGRTRRNAYWESALPSCHLIHRKVSQSKFSELFMTSVACAAIAHPRRVTTYTFILSLLQRSIHPLTTYAPVSAPLTDGSYVALPPASMSNRIRERMSPLITFTPYGTTTRYFSPQPRGHFNDFQVESSVSVFFLFLRNKGTCLAR